MDGFAQHTTYLDGSKRPLCRGYLHGITTVVAFPLAWSSWETMPELLRPTVSIYSTRRVALRFRRCCDNAFRLTYIYAFGIFGISLTIRRLPRSWQYVGRSSFPRVSTLSRIQTFQLKIALEDWTELGL